MAMEFCYTLIFGSMVVAFRSAKAAALSRSERRQPTRTSNRDKTRGRLLTAIFTALVCEFIASAGFAADLAKIDRTIVKEPAYKSAPKYCLLVFGPEAATRVWLVLD